MVSYSLKPYAFLMVNFALLLKPSTTPEDKPWDSNQLSRSGSCLSNVADIFCMGSICDWFARMHQSRKNFDAHVGDVYVQNRLKSSRSTFRYAGNISVHANLMPWRIDSSKIPKNPCKLASVRSFATYIRTDAFSVDRNQDAFYDRPSK